MGWLEIIRLATGAFLIILGVWGIVSWAVTNPNARDGRRSERNVAIASLLLGLGTLVQPWAVWVAVGLAWAGAAVAVTNLLYGPGSNRNSGVG